MEAYLRCLISRGMFSGEVAVRGKTAYGTEFSLFVPEDFVEADHLTAEADAVEGWLRVVVLAREGALMLLRLPSETFENGRTVTVSDSEVEIRPRHEAV
jgi:hypothetical protein